MPLPDPEGMSTDEMVRVMYEAMSKFLDHAVPVIEELKPTLDGILENPMIKVLVGKGKRNG